MATGEFYTEKELDFKIKSRGFDRPIIRQYKNQLVYNGPFRYGWGWNHGNALPLDSGGVNYDNDQGILFEITLYNPLNLLQPKFTCDCPGLSLKKTANCKIVRD